MIVLAMQAAIAAAMISFAAALFMTARRVAALRWPGFEAVALGAVTNFFDALGVGSFAPTTAWMRFRRLLPDAFIPATLNVGHAVPTMMQGLIFIQLIRVNPVLLLACVLAAAAGAALGAPIVARAPARAIRAAMGVALLIAAGLYAASNLQWLPTGGDALTLVGPLFAVAVAAHVVLGALMTVGVGLYAPSLILLSLLGLDPKAAFPIMMGACAFLMPVGGARFLGSGRLSLTVAIGLAVGGVPAVLIAAFVVKSLPLETVRWGVVLVVLYTAALMLKAAATHSDQAAETDRLS
jgi:uncharacterized membrane protein YfcA